MPLRLTAALLCATALAGAADHPLLPQPRSVQPGSGTLRLTQPKIGFVSPPDADDRLAEAALRWILTEAGAPPATSGIPVIMLERTGRQSSWTWGDPAGPAGSEAYSLSVTPTQVRLRAPSARGLFYAVQTLRQLLRNEPNGGASLPVIEIHDWPDRRLRGFMLDLAHGPFPKFEELKRQIDFLARWKTNQFYLYSETNIELQGYPLLSPRNRLSQAQVRELIAYAHDRFIDVVPCVELYGHLHDLVRLETYSALGEMPHGGEVDPRNPATLKLMEDWIGQLTVLFPSPWLHIGLDETYELGKRPGARLEPRQTGETYLSYLGQLSKLVTARGKRVMVWGDILLEHPDLMAQVPAGTVAIPWRYSDEPSYDRFVQPLADGKVRSLLASGVWNYYDAVPDFDHTLRNVDGLLRSIRKFNLPGLVHTEWTDCGQVFLRMADPAVAYGPIAAWQPETMTRDTYYDRYARLLHPTQAATAARVFATLSQAQSTLESAFGQRVFQSLWYHPLEPRRLRRARAEFDKIKAGRRLAESAQADLLALTADQPDPLFSSLLYGARLLDYMALRQIYSVELDDFRQALAAEPKTANYRLLFGIETSDHTHSRLFDLMDAAGELKAGLRDLWLQEYEPYRLETALGRWQAEFDRWRRLQEKLAGGNSYHDGDAPPELAPSEK